MVADSIDNIPELERSRDDTLELLRERRGEELWLVLSGHLGARQSRALYDQLTQVMDAEALPGRGVVLDFGQVESLDSSGIAVISQATEWLHDAGGTLRLEGLSADQREALNLMPSRPHGGLKPPPSPGIFEDVGAQTMDAWEQARAFWELSAAVLLELGRMATFRSRPPKGAILEQAVRLGVNALPIIFLLSILLGLIMGFEGAIQFKAYGANIYIANLVGSAMSREFGPLLAAIILSGRSGAAIAAELGTMKVSEEIDALRVMGLEPTRYLVVPRVLALILVQPALSLMSVLLGMFGGMFIAVYDLDITALGYWNQMVLSITAQDMTLGIVKSFAFSIIISMLGCYHGLNLRGGASAVGQATMTAVVSSIFMIIVVDAFLTAANAYI
ncbi:MAG: MlaE family lipid ABC transporter permease subunit [Myxococcota bacterium]